MKVIAIIQARMGSTRLPGKVLKKIEGLSLLEHMVNRVKLVSTIDKVIIATTTNEIDDAVANASDKLGVDCFRGSEDDVLSRFYNCALKYKAEYIVRLTSDCPLIDFRVINEVVKVQLDNPRYDYVSTGIRRSFPRGMDTEVFTFSSLSQTHEEAADPRFREHVTLYMYSNPKLFKLKNYAYTEDLSNYRLTVDTIEDFKLVEAVFNILGKSPRLSFQAIVKFLDRNPEIKKINSNIHQKKV